MPFNIEKVDKLPITPKNKSKEYDDIVNTILDKEVGIYLITANKKDGTPKQSSTLYLQLSKKLLKQPYLEIYRRGKEVFIQKLDKPKQLKPKKPKSTKPKQSK